MNYKKCPKCELNYIKDEEELCDNCMQNTYQLGKGGKVTRIPKPRPEGNIAFKCAYCNGGESDTQLGYAGICTEENIKRNIEVKKQPCCSDAVCPCYEYYIGKRKLEDIELGKSCYESRMLIDWKAQAGQDRKEGERKGKCRKLKKNVKNGLCVLTTVLPDDNEKQRVVFGVFIIDKFFEGDENIKEGYAQCTNSYKVKLTPVEASRIRFWNYYYSPESQEKADWSSGLYRYLDDIQCLQILRDILDVKRGAADEKIVDNMIDEYCALKKLDRNSIPQNNGALTR